jgi:hypothetical protein
MRAESMAQDFGPDVFLGERQRYATISGPNEVGIFQLDREDLFNRDKRVGRRGAQTRL